MIKYILSKISIKEMIAINMMLVIFFSLLKIVLFDLC
jgi:hypothetical protein